MALAVFERVALPAMRRPRTGGVVVVDELGKMELASAAFCDAVVELFGREVAVVATVQLPATGSPMPSSAGPTSGWFGSEGTRDALPMQLMDWLVGGRTGELR